MVSFSPLFFFFLLVPEQAETGRDKDGIVVLHTRIYCIYLQLRENRNKNNSKNKRVKIKLCLVFVCAAQGGKYDSELKLK